MVKAMRNSSLHIALSGKASDLDDKIKKKIDYTFNSLFEDSSEIVSSVEVTTEGELIYEIKTPVVNDKDITREFFENIEVLLDELTEFNPHFTQFKRVDS